MPKSASVKDYMSRIRMHFNPDMEVLQAVRIMLEKDLPGGPVLDNVGNLVGVLSVKDCMEPALDATYHEERAGRVAEFMRTEVETVDAEDSIADVAKLFIQRAYTHFPVLHENRLVGQINRQNVLRALEDLRHDT